MYKLILVDDEEEVRKGILKKIDWSSCGFQVIGEAENGLEALEIAEKIIPDVVITDIKMPFVDGLTLSQKLKEKFPTIKIIILTGFDEFDYAKKAIKLDVIEYALKPISSKELTDVLTKVKCKIDEEIAEKKDIETLKEYYNKSLPLLREKFLCSLVTSRMSSHEIFEKSKTYGLSFKGSSFIAACMSIDSEITEEKNENHYNKKSNLGIWPNFELVKFAVLNITEEIITKYGLGTVFMDSEYIVIIFSSEEEKKDILVCKILSILEEIRQSIEKFIKFTVTVGVGTSCSNIEEINNSYENAIAALNYRIILNGNRVICIEDMEPQRGTRVVFDELKEKSLVNCIKVGTNNEIQDTIDSLFKEIINSGTSFKDYHIYLLEILTTVLKSARDLNVDMDNLFGVNYNIFVELYKFNNLKDVKDWLTRTCVKIRRSIYKEREDNCKFIIKNAITFIENNYCDSNLTIDKVCKFLHISATYFSTIFKKETKLTFVNYLTQVRMEASKELLRTTNLKTLEIAYKVGYSEANYFSYCFKRYYNISPSEYRKVFLTL